MPRQHRREQHEDLVEERGSQALAGDSVSQDMSPPGPAMNPSRDMVAEYRIVAMGLPPEVDYADPVEMDSAAELIDPTAHVSAWRGRAFAAGARPRSACAPWAGPWSRDG
jgi:hypothetical protein